jgi:uncharacterized protein YqgQ
MSNNGTATQKNFEIYIKINQRTLHSFMQLHLPRIFKHAIKDLETYFLSELIVTKTEFC